MSKQQSYLNWAPARTYGLFSNLGRLQAEPRVRPKPPGARHAVSSTPFSSFKWACFGGAGHNAPVLRIHDVLNEVLRNGHHDDLDRRVLQHQAFHARR